MRAYEKGDGDSGHYQAIKQDQRQLQRKERTYRHMRCDKDDDHDKWDGLGPSQQVQRQVIPAWQVVRSHGYRPRSNPMGLQPLTPSQVNGLSAAGALLLLARFAWILAL